MAIRAEIAGIAGHAPVWWPMESSSVIYTVIGGGIHADIG
jgi:hypothetical protein